jgi:manganese/zinc/iron transport system ATP- binding protein
MTEIPHESGLRATQQEAATPAVVFEQVTASYAKNTVLRDLSVRLPAGQMISITGPNGAGKTTMVRALLGLHPIDRGTIQVFGQPVDKVRGRLAYVPQTDSVDWDFPITAEEVVMMGRYPYLGAWKRIGKDDREAVADALETVGMAEYRHRHIRQLSGGQQQRIFIARALAQKADMMLLDEPFTGIDARTEEALFSLTGQLSGQGKTLLIVNHNLSLLDRFDFVLFLNRTTIAAGPPSVVVTQENLRRTYGGRMLHADFAAQKLREGDIDVRR